VVVDGNVISSRSPADLLAFYSTILKEFVHAAADPRQLRAAGEPVRFQRHGLRALATLCGDRRHDALKGPELTTTYPAAGGAMAANKVYPPQHDSLLLVDAMQRTNLVAGRRVLDLCTGSGVVAIAAAALGATSVTAFDICPYAVKCSRGNAADAHVDIDIHQGSWTRARGCAPFEVIVSNPPYVPAPPTDDTPKIPSTAGPSWTWNGGLDGRHVLNPLCESASSLLCAGGCMLLVQSDFADIQRSLDTLRSTGMYAETVASQWVPFGPVLTARASWLESTGRLSRGCREEQLVVIRADKP
jgi:release factor glutamine methyltransferase